MYHDLSGERLRCPAGLIGRRFDGQLLVLGVEDDEVERVDGLTAAVLTAAWSGATVEQLEGVVSAELQRDSAAVFSTVVQLLRRGWLEIVPHGSPDGPSSGCPASDVSAVAERVVQGVLALLPATSLGPTEWLRRVQIDRLTPLAELVTRGQSGLVPDGAASALADAARDRVCWSMMAERSGLDAARVLSAHGVRFVALKGIAAAHLDYHDPALRELGDVDFLVDPADVPAADVALRSIADPMEELSDGLRLRNKERVFCTATNVEIDLHHRLLEDPFGRAVPVRQLFDTATPFVVAGVRLLALGTPYRLAHAVTHWAASPLPSRRASSLVDVVAMSGDLDAVERAREILAGWSLGCLAGAVSQLPGQPRADRSRARSVLFQRSLQGSRLANELAAVVAEPSLAGRGRQVWARLHPSDELMALHGVSRSYRLVRFSRRVMTSGRG